MAEGKGRRKGEDVFWGRSVEVKVGTLNFGTLTGMVREQANVMREGRRIFFVCRRSGGRESRPALEMDSSCSTMVYVGIEME